MARIYFYKMTVDVGAAPCVAGKLLSLAICKPAIRRTAQCGDYVIGFAADSLYRDNRLIYVAKVTDCRANGEYFRDREFSGREDCVYAWRGHALVLRAGAQHHTEPGNALHDLGVGPGYPSAKTLLSNDFRYHPAPESIAYPLRYPLVKAAIARLGPGHRVNHAPELQRELQKLIDACFASARSSGSTTGAKMSAKADAGTRRSTPGCKPPMARPRRN